MRNITEDEALRLVLAGTAGETGVPFFRALAQSLSEVLGTMAAMVTEYRAVDRRLNALAFVIGGKFIEGHEYLVDNTPCALALEKGGVMHFRERLPDFFPDDKDLLDMGFVSYLGCPLLDRHGGIMGLLAVLDNKPMPAERRFMSLFELFAARAAAEHRRLRMERELHARHAAHGLSESRDHAVLELDAAWHIRKASSAAEQLFACTGEDLVGESVSEFLVTASARHLQDVASRLTGIDAGGEWLPDVICAQKWDHSPFEAEASVSRFEHEGDVSYLLILRPARSGDAATFEIAAETDKRGNEDQETIIGRSDPMRRLKRALAQVAATDATVLILGETGTGKELVAREIHAASRRREKALVRVNCAAMPDNLIESEFFGHEKGAFTGATARREGRFAMADGGTLFLDEVGELPLELQSKLLRVLQEGEFEPVGSDRTRKVDVRVIAATNRDLAQAVREGTFREDLFYRLNVFPLHVPPLRERGEDVCRLAEIFLHRFSRVHRLPPKLIQPSDSTLLRSHPWPGNVRELQNTIERALIVSGREPSLSLAHAMNATAVMDKQIVVSEGEIPRILTAAELEKIERENLIRALDHCGGKISGFGGAAALLGIPPSTFSSKMKALGIRRRD